MSTGLAEAVTSRHLPIKHKGGMIMRQCKSLIEAVK